MLTSCETLSDIELNDGNDNYVLTAFLYPDSNAIVNVYGSVAYGENKQYSYVTSASISLIQNEASVFESKLQDCQTKVEFPLVKWSVGDHIKINAIVEGQTIRAETDILPVVYIDTVKLEQESDTRDRVCLNVTMTDNAQTTDYYQLAVRRKITDSNGKVTYSLVDCEYLNYLFYIDNSDLSITSIGLFNDADFNGQQTILRLAFSRRKIMADIIDGSEVTIEVLLYHHTYDYYYYAKSVQSANNYMILPVFVTPSVYSNVDGALGIVSGMVFDKKEINIK